MLWVMSKNTSAESLLHIYLDSEYQEIQIIQRTHVVVCYPQNNHACCVVFLIFILFLKKASVVLLQEKKEKKQKKPTDNVFCS